jgi:hypothetical protein
MASRGRFVPSRRAIAALLKGPRVRRLVEDRTREIKEAAERASDDGLFRTDLGEENTRVRGAVIGDYTTRDAEKSRRALLRGLEGGRTS